MAGWSLTYDGFDPESEGLRETLCTLGNGYFCTRGAGNEAAADGTHYPGTYIAGGYNRMKTEIDGHILENEDLVNMPNWLPLTFRIAEGSWFSPSEVAILDYRQELDLKQGILKRNIRFEDRDGRRTRLAFRRLVHMRQPHLAAQEFELTAENWSGRVELRSALDGTVTNGGVERYRRLDGRHLDPIRSEQPAGDTICLRVITHQSRLKVAMAARTRLHCNGRAVTEERRTMSGKGCISQLIGVTVEEGVPLTAEKIVAVYTSKDPAISEPGREACFGVRKADDFKGLLKSHALTWKHLWETFDMTFDPSDGQAGDPISEVLHLHIFHLLQTSSINTMGLDLDVGVPPRGWHGEAYRGHILWDELFIFPLLNWRLPEITRRVLLYRYRRLDAAREAARAGGYRGAMFPWQSGSDGREESQELHLNPRSGRWVPDHSRLQRHVNAAIAYNVYQYYQVTRDTEFLTFYGAELILEIARFWGSITTFSEEHERYVIRGVMGPDEYHEGYPDADSPGLDNNAYTNVMAVWVLARALEVLELLPEDHAGHIMERLDLKENELDRWRDITRRMRIPFHDDGIISQFEGYETLEELDWDAYREKYDDIHRLDRILEAENDSANRYRLSKQADVLMLFYLFSAEELAELFHSLGYAFEHDTIPRNIDYYIRRTSDGSTLSRVVHSWVLARQDRHRSWKLFKEALYSDVLDIQGGTTAEGIHLGAMAGTVDQVQRCYTGIVTRSDVLWLNPCLPDNLARLKLNVRYRGFCLGIDIGSGQVDVTVLRAAGCAIRVGFGENVVELTGPQKVTFSTT
ncbi:MAG: glycoside hydrolase family 65 protein [Desulfobacterales bacterium]